MPLHDYRCACGRVRRDVYRSISEGARAVPPLCDCGLVMDWIPKVGRIDAASGSTFVAFDTEIQQPDGSYKTVHVSSLRQLRGIEKDSEQRARDGEGSPLVWRDFSQDASNKDTNVFGLDPATKAREELDALIKETGHKPKSYLREVFPDQASADLDYGPGVSDATTSAL